MISYRKTDSRRVEIIDTASGRIVDNVTTSNDIESVSGDGEQVCVTYNGLTEVYEYNNNSLCLVNRF